RDRRAHHDRLHRLPHAEPQIESDRDQHFDETVCLVFSEPRDRHLPRGRPRRTQSIAYLPPPLRRRFVSMRGPLLSLVTLASVAAAAGMAAQTPHLGAIDFPTSGAPAAQASFIRGVLLLHSFEYRDAAQAFREAQRIDPRFALAYWGEALTYTHPVWNEQDRTAARAVLQRLGPSAEARRAKAPTLREQEYLHAVE